MRNQEKGSISYNGNDDKNVLQILLKNAPKRKF